MKKQIFRLVLGFVYICLLTWLLLSQISMIGNAAEKWTAMLSALVIGVPWLIVLKLYILVNNSEISEDTTDLTKKNVNVQEAFESAMPEYGLTEREKEVAWLLYRGYTNRQIGEELFIAETTVKKHVSHIYEKMHVMSRKEFRAKIETASFPAPETARLRH